MNQTQKQRLKNLSAQLDKLNAGDIKDIQLKKNCKDDLSLLYYSLPIIFEKDWKNVGFDVLDKNRLDFYESGHKFFGLDQIDFAELFYEKKNISETQMKEFRKYRQFNIEEENNFKKIRKNIKKILESKK